MKKSLILGFFLGLSISLTLPVLGSFSAGQRITIEFINKILDISLRVEETSFMAKINSNGSIHSQTPAGWISSSNCRVGTGNYTCNLSLNNQEKMVCVIGKAENGNGVVTATLADSASTSSYIRVRTHYSTKNQYLDREWSIHCMKKGIDYTNSFKTIREILENTGFIF